MPTAESVARVRRDAIAARNPARSLDMTRSMLRGHAQAAVMVLTRALEDEDPAIRLRAAESILDRAYGAAWKAGGPPVQGVHVRVELVEAGRVIDVGSG